MNEGDILAITDDALLAHVRQQVRLYWAEWGVLRDVTCMHLMVLREECLNRTLESQYKEIVAEEKAAHNLKKQTRSQTK